MKCKHCKDGIYCKTCFDKLVEENIYSTCSVCRGNNWYEEDKMECKLHNNVKGIPENTLEEESIVVVEISHTSTERVTRRNHIRECCKYLISYKFVKDLCCTISLTIILTVIGWSLIFGICGVKLKVNEGYQILCIVIISLIGGIASLIVVWGMIFRCLMPNYNE